MDESAKRIASLTESRPQVGDSVRYIVPDEHELALKGNEGLHSSQPFPAVVQYVYAPSGNQLMMDIVVLRKKELIPVKSIPFIIGTVDAGLFGNGYATMTNTNRELKNSMLFILGTLDELRKSIEVVSGKEVIIKGYEEARKGMQAVFNVQAKQNKKIEDFESFLVGFKNKEMAFEKSVSECNTFLLTDILGKDITFKKTDEGKEESERLKEIKKYDKQIKERLVRLDSFERKIEEKIARSDQIVTRAEDELFEFNKIKSDAARLVDEEQARRTHALLGCTVMLKSGGPVMTAARLLEHGNIECMFFVNDEIISKSIPADALKACDQSA